MHNETNLNLMKWKRLLFFIALFAQHYCKIFTTTFLPSKIFTEVILPSSIITSCPSSVEAFFSCVLWPRELPHIIASTFMWNFLQ